MCLLFVFCQLCCNLAFCFRKWVACTPQSVRTVRCRSSKLPHLRTGMVLATWISSCTCYAVLVSPLHAMHKTQAKLEYHTLFTCSDFTGTNSHELSSEKITIWAYSWMKSLLQPRWCENLIFFSFYFFLSGIDPDKPRYQLGLWNHTAAVIFWPTKGSCKVYTQTERKHQWI